MMIAFLLITIALLFFALCVAVFYLLRFARIIMAIEETLEEALTDFIEIQTSLENLLSMQMFFESREVKQAVNDALQDVILSKMTIVKTIRNFTRLSKQQYEMVNVNDETDKEDMESATRRY